jgi:uncharacterized protein (TIGR03083 family)
MTGADLTNDVARLRRQFAERIEELDETAWSAASWCARWRVRDVLAHLAHNAEATYATLAIDVIRGGFRPDRIVSKAVERLRGVPVPDLAHRLRAGAEGGVHLPGFPPAVGLGDVPVHTADAFRPLGLDVGAPPAEALLALDAFLQRGKTIVHAAPHRGRRLIASDVDWSWGDGPEVTGAAIDLLLLVANRRQVVSCLRGPGVAGL